MIREGMIFLTVLAAGITCGHAEIPSTYGGDDLFALCDTNRDLVTGYVVGAIDVYLISEAIAPKEAFRVCLSSNATVDQVTDAFCEFVADHPEQRQYAAGSLVWTAINENWPCPAT